MNTDYNKLIKIIITSLFLNIVFFNFGQNLKLYSYDNWNTKLIRTKIDNFGFAITNFDNNRPINQKVFSIDSILLLEMDLNDIDTTFLTYNYDSTLSVFNFKKKEIVIKENIYKYYINAKTFYANGFIRSEYYCTKNKVESKTYTKSGEKLYHNLITITDTIRDTIEGIFKVDSYYDWIRFDVFRKGKKQFQFQIPITGISNNAVNTNLNTKLLNKCNQDFCITNFYRKLSDRKINKYLRIINLAIENELIINLDACYYQ